MPINLLLISAPLIHSRLWRFTNLFTYLLTYLVLSHIMKRIYTVYIVGQGGEEHCQRGLIVFLAAYFHCSYRWIYQWHNHTAARWRTYIKVIVTDAASLCAYLNLQCVPRFRYSVDVCVCSITVSSCRVVFVLDLIMHACVQVVQYLTTVTSAFH